MDIDLNHRLALLLNNSVGEVLEIALESLLIPLSADKSPVMVVVSDPVAYEYRGVLELRGCPVGRRDGACSQDFGDLLDIIDSVTGVVGRLLFGGISN